MRQRSLRFDELEIVQTCDHFLEEHAQFEAREL
jgi:hypothetical protein